jgi:hypothetical protein
MLETDDEPNQGSSLCNYILVMMQLILIAWFIMYLIALLQLQGRMILKDESETMCSQALITYLMNYISIYMEGLWTPTESFSHDSL